VLDISQIDEVITDAGTSPTDMARLSERGVAVRIASGNHPAQEPSAMPLEPAAELLARAIRNRFAVGYFESWTWHLLKA